MRGSRQQGQLAVGLAFSFLTILALFALVFQSSLLTREKMKLQQTTDLAALAGAEVQRQNLNRIVEINEAIDKAFHTASIDMAFPWCQIPIPLGTGNEMTSAINTVNDYITAQGRSRIATCEQACQAFEGLIRDRIVTGYETFLQLAHAEIFSSLDQANSNAQALSERVLFTRDNLPLRLRRLIEKRYGQQASAAQLYGAYQAGELQDYVSVIRLQEELPLFAPKVEARTFKYSKLSATTVYPLSPFSTPMCQISGATPALTATSGKIGRVGELNASFFSGVLLNFANLQSPVEHRFALDIRYPYHPKRESTNVNLIQSRFQMMAVALAKPFGGRYPEAGQILTDPGFPGEDFDGVKLIGLADDLEQGVNIYRDIPVSFGDPQAQPTLSFYLGKEVLH